MNIRFLYVCLLVVYVRGASIQQRDITAKPPCFLADSELPVTVNVLDTYLEDITKAIDVSKFQTESLLRSMQTNCIDFSTDEMESVGFMDHSSLNADTDSRTFLQDFCSNTQSFVNQMRAHYDMLNELTNYYEELRKNSVFDNPQDFQEHIFDTMCRIKMALRSINHDPVVTVPSGTLSELFVMYQEQGQNTVCKQQISEYAATLDTRRIVTYLETIYSPFNTTTSKCI